MTKAPLLVVLLAASATIYGAARERHDWSEVFSEFGAKGTIVVVDERGEDRTIQFHDHVRASTRFSPASTFKVPHMLFALDAGLARDEFQVFPWDGVERSFPAHNRDQDLRSAMRYSALWVYQRFASEIGQERARAYLESIDYGNADPTTEGDGAYWVDGRLAITALEQIAFLKRLYRNALPFEVEHQRLVKDVMIVEAGREWILRAKTGWDGRIGWWVGWVEWPSGPVFFALNIDTPYRNADLDKREQITRAILESIDGLPGS